MNESVLNTNVGLKLRTLRLKRNIKQSDAARELGVSPAYLNLIEKGKRVMPFPLLWKALRLLKEDPERFMSDLGEGRVDEALAKVSGGLTEVAVAGRIRHKLATMLGEARDLGVENPDARILLRLAHEAWKNGGKSTTQVEALNDQSDVFFESDS